MRQLFHLTALALAITIITTLAGCGGASSPQPGQPVVTPPVTGALPLAPAAQAGVQMPTAQPVDIDFDNLDKGASAAYRIFFRDSVNEQSGGRWSVINTSGAKQWTLSNTFFSSPKAWVIGQNYWNREDDQLGSNFFNVDDGEDGLAVAFYARFDIAPGDFGAVWYFDGLTFQQVVAFSAGTNPSYPGWDKYYFKLPANLSGLAQNCAIAATFQSDTSVTGWGFGIDSVAVYQTQLGTPLNLAATEDFAVGQVDLGWDHNNQGNLVPDGYDIYRAPDVGGVPGAYGFLSAVPYPVQTYSDFTNSADTYWYKVVATKNGWPDSAESNADSGWGIGQWMTTQVDSDDVQYTSVADINGMPAIAYYDPTNDDLRYAYSATDDGTGPWTEVLVDSIGDVGFQPSLALINGFPAIAYFDATNADLKYAYSLTVDGSAGWIPITVDFAGSVGPYASLKLNGAGFPAISYNDALGDLKYAYSATSDGSALWTAVYVEGPGGNLTGYDTSMALNGIGNPGIAHGDNTAPALLYTTNNQPDGSGGWFTGTVDNTAQGFYMSQALVNGNPAISYDQGGGGTLRFAYNDLPQGDGTWTHVFVDAAGLYTNLFVFHGLPSIVYYYNPTAELRIATSPFVDGNSGWAPDVIDTGNVGEYCSAALVNGKPAAAYRDLANGDLKFAWLQ